MGSTDALVVWAILANVSGALSTVGAIVVGNALRIVRRRRGAGTLAERLVVTRDSQMFGVLFVSEALGIVTASVLVALIPLYGSELDAVLAKLAIPIMIAYAGYTLQTFLVAVVAPLWLLARWRAIYSGRTGGHDGDQG